MLFITEPEVTRHIEVIGDERGIVDRIDGRFNVADLCRQHLEVPVPALPC